MDVALRSAVEERGRPSSGAFAGVQKLIRALRPHVGNGAATKPATRVAVLGLYRSGSTAVAGVMHHLGVDMCPPYFQNYYESAWLSQKLRMWWNEPENKERIPAAKRVRILHRWIRKQEARGANWVGMKHPLLSLCGPDLLAAWGPSMRFVWTFRPLENSIRSLIKLKWWDDARSGHSQRSLWNATHDFLSGREHLRIDFAEMMAEPRQQVVRLAEYLGLAPSEAQIAMATNYIQPTSKE
jgi:Sulfotransferase family